jgi:hypothetical protein
LSYGQFGPRIGLTMRKPPRCFVILGALNEWFPSATRWRLKAAAEYMEARLWEWETVPRGRVQQLPGRELRHRFRALQKELAQRYVRRVWADDTDKYLRGWWPDRATDRLALDHPEIIRKGDYPAELLENSMKHGGGPYKLASALICKRYRISRRSLDRITRKK